MPAVRVMNPTQTKAELLEELRRVRQERDQLQSQLKAANPRKGNPVSSRTDLVAQIRALREENDELQDKLDDIADLASAPEDEKEQTQDNLVDALNDILDIAAPGCKDTDDEGEE